MGDKVPAGKVFRLGLATVGIGFALLSGAMLGESRAEAADGDSATIERGRQLFQDWSCGSCHVLKDAGGAGHVGPRSTATR